MTKQISFRAYERRVLPQFREKMNKAESAEEVRKVFIHTVEGLLNSVLDTRVKLKGGDLVLLPDADPYYEMSENLRSHESLSSYWRESDLPHVTIVLHNPPPGGTSTWPGIRKRPSSRSRCDLGGKTDDRGKESETEKHRQYM